MPNSRYTLQEVLRIFELEDDFDDVESEVEEDDGTDVLPMNRAELLQADDEIAKASPDIPIADSQDNPCTSRDSMTVGDNLGNHSQPTKKPTSRDFQFKWQKTVNHHDIEPYATDPYVVNHRLRVNASPLKCFESLFTDEVFSLMATMTTRNYYRKQSIRDRLRPSSPEPSKRRHEIIWRDITVPEMKAFIGLVIAMGMLRLPDIAMYWRSQSWLFRIPSFAEVMSRDRFRQIYRHLHFSDISTDENITSQQPSTASSKRDTTSGPDKLRKIRAFLELVRGKFLSEFVVGKNISIDESMIPFKGRISFRQCLPAKRTRYGIKVWVLADSESAYVPNFQIYVGRDPRAEVDDRFGLSGAVVLKLMEPFQHQGRCLYMDNFYTSPSLVEELYRLKTYACGTVRPTTKGFPKDLVLKVHGAGRCQQGYMDWRMSGHIVCYCWNDNKPVYLMSTIHLPHDENVSEAELFTVKRRKTTGQRESREIPCPPPIKDYNRFMGGVDSNDQLRKYYNISRKSNIWYRKVFGYVLEVAVHNARVMYECARKEKCHAVLFRQELCMALIGDFRAGRVRTSIDHETPRLNKSLEHLPTKDPDGKRKNCAFCSRRASAASTKGVKLSVPKCYHICITCNVHLCTNDRDCFRQWHKCADFWP